MAKTKSKPGPKGKGNRRDYHIRVSADVQQGETMSLADAFEKAADIYAEEQREQGNPVQGAVIAFAEKVLRDHPDIAKFFKGEVQ